MALQSPRGTHDLFPETNQRHGHIVEKARQIAMRFGCGEIATPIFESTEVFKRTLGESSDIVNKEMYTFKDRNGDLLTLRPEGTAGIVRAFISHSLHRQLPLKYFYQGPMFRYERPQRGRLRQFHQVGVEFLGIDSFWADIEIISMAHIFFQELGLSSNIELEINTIGDIASRQLYREELVRFFERHQSQLSQESLKRLDVNPLRILDSKDPSDQEVVAQAPPMNAFLNETSQQIYSDICTALDEMGIPYKKNTRLVRGLDYYTHCVFEFKSHDLGSQNTVLAGGRYNGLISLMGGPHTVGVGWACGIERMNLILQQIPPRPRPLGLIPMGKKAETQALRIAHQLRQKGFVIHVILGGHLQKRMKKAHRAAAFGVLILGDNELTQGVIQFKDLDSGNQTPISLTELPQYLLSSPHLKSHFITHPL